MKDFDELLSSDHEFKVRDQVFTFNDVRPEILSTFSVNGKEEDVWAVLDAQVLMFLDEDGQKRWKELRARDENPVTIAQIQGILQYLMEQQTGRPFEQLQDSEAGPGVIAPTSTPRSKGRSQT